MSTSEQSRDAVEVFWRPGCPYCSALRRDLARRGVSAAWRNIWTDIAAREFVRSVNGGNETVPTVRVGQVNMINPTGQEVADLVGRGAEPTADVGGRSAGWRLRWLASWIPVLLLVAGSELLTRDGHAGFSWAIDGAAFAAWALTRPLRR